MEKQAKTQPITFKFNINLFKKNDIIGQTLFTHQAFKTKQCIPIILKKVQEYLEATVIEKGFVTTYAGIFCAVYSDSKLVFVIAYHPSFRYEIIKDKKDIYNFINDITPGLKL